MLYIKHHPTLSLLEALEAVCRTGEFSSAADELALAQPAVSAQIRQLESEIGTPLVERFGKSARATPAGAVLIEGTLRVVAELDRMINMIEALKHGRSFADWCRWDGDDLSVAAGSVRTRQIASAFQPIS